ncbi:MAG: HEAT repeat domain-containing protein [Pyrinomonadaceae bacterium]
MKMLSIAYTIALLLSTFCVSFAQDTAKHDSADVQHLLAKFSSDNDAVRSEALQALSKFGKDVVPLIKETLKNQTGYAQVYAARVLLNIEPENQLALKTLAEIARNKGERKEVRRYASYVMALSSSGINTLAGMLKDEDVFVRRSAAFALEELNENGAFLPPALIQPLYNSLTALASALADDDKIVSGVSAEAFMQIHNENIPALNEAAKSSNARLRKAALEVLERRKSGYTPEGLEAEAKPGFEEKVNQSPEFLHGNLGLIRALRMGGEPVRDFRSIPDAKSPFSVHIVLKSSNRKMSIRKNQFNPYEDLR